MIIEELTPGLHEAWDRYVDANASSTCYHLRAWQSVAQSAYRLRAPFLLARDGRQGEVRGVLPLFVVNAPFRSHLASGLFGAYGRILGDTEEIRRALVLRALSMLDAHGLSNLVLKQLGDDFPDIHGFESSGSWVIATLPLNNDPDRLWRDFRDKIRNCVRKAQRHGLEIRRGSDQLISFYRVLSENMRSKGTPLYGIAFFEALARSLGERAEVLTLWHHDEPVSGAFLIRHNKTLYVPFASSLPSALHMCPNNLLYWEIIREACLDGMEKLDFGRSLRNSGPLAFKLGWGGVVEEQPCYIFSSSGRALRPDAKDRRVEWFVKQWKRLPSPAAERLGPWVCRRVAGIL